MNQLAGLVRMLPDDPALPKAAGSVEELAEICQQQGTIELGCDRYGHLLPHAEERVTNALDSLGRAGAAKARDAIVLEFPREERAKNGPERDASRPPRRAVPALTWGVTSGASKNRTYDLILIRDAL